MADRFQERFVRDLKQFSKEHGFIITENGTIEPIADWIEPHRDWEYVVGENEEGNLQIKDIQIL